VQPLTLSMTLDNDQETGRGKHWIGIQGNRFSPMRLAATHSTTVVGQQPKSGLMAAYTAEPSLA